MVIEIIASVHNLRCIPVLSSYAWLDMLKCGLALVEVVRPDSFAKHCDSWFHCEVEDLGVLDEVRLAFRFARDFQFELLSVVLSDIPKF
jgi:hypothetical protein